MAEKSKALASGFALPKPPKRTPVAEPEAERFVGVDADPPPKTAKSAAPRDSKLRRASRGERVAVYLPPELAAKLRVKCAEERRSVSDAITAAVGSWLKETQA